ncbi:hypothetical protein [Mycobacterium arosiense]|uniref:hypothetical protein n=1 Tax=Mycobacterium arosiense TaxID=425468 RepID=UPI001301FC29|nr:hypothetical protein [Mycobacterium arosiense]
MSATFNANRESADNKPVFGQLMPDEAFSKSDPPFAQQDLQAFRREMRTPAALVPAGV